MDDVVSSIRSCIISTKGKLSLRQLEDDFRILLGEPIHYSRFGFKSLESFLASVPSLLLTRGADGQTYVDAKPDKKTEHISYMVQKQKSAAPKRRAPPKFSGYRTNTSRAYTQPSGYGNKWRPKNSFGGQSRNPQAYNKSPRLTAVAHNQFVSGYRKPDVPSKIVVPLTNNANRYNASSNKNTENYRSFSRQSSLSATPSPPLPSSPESSPSPKSDTKHNVKTVRFEKNGGKTNSVSISSNGDSAGNFSLSSCKKRIIKVMSEMSLDRDSGNSSPTTDYSAQYKRQQEFVATGDIVVDLKNFVEFHKLGELEIKFTENKPKKSKVSQYHCKIRVGQSTYSNYPIDCYNTTDAEKLASQKALDDLMPKHSRRRSLLISSNEDIIERIPPMLEKHQSAVWMWQMEADYIDRYNEQLPADWLKVIDSSPFVSIEKCPGGYVLKHCDPDDILQKGKKLDINLNVFDVSVPCNTIQFGEHNRISAMVVFAPSAFEIWCQQCGTPEYDNFCYMIEAMNMYYNTNSDIMKAKSIHVNSCYVILDENKCWVRVRALSLSEDGDVDCFSFDNGKQYSSTIEEVFLLRREFAVEQAQAFVCRLVGLEDLYEASAGSVHLSDLEEKEFIVEMVADESENNVLTIPTVMYDANGESINESLILLLTTELSTPVLNEHSITEVHLSNIEADGDCFVQIHSPAYIKLLELMDELSTTIHKTSPDHLREPMTSKSTENRLFLARFNDQWMRGKFVDWSPDGSMAQVYFVDYGHAAVFSVRKDIFYPLDKLDPYIHNYPHQAIKVRIMIENLPEDFVDKALKFMPKDQAILLKIISRDNENVAWVEFFKRSADGVLLCINKSIVMEAELRAIDSSSNNDKIAKRRLMLVQINENTKNVPSGGSLDKPNLPAKGGYFNVKVPFAVNPWNFFVQPLDTFQELNNMMEDMQEFCNNTLFSPLHIEDVVAGKIYASLHEDGRWYRTSVLKVIHSTSISVFYCDFGYYTNLTLRQLVPLDSKYMEMPYQALKAKLADIKPSKSKWTMEDCEYFKNLVTGQHFVSVILDIEKDELYRSDSVLKLHLIDTTGTEDVHIKAVLTQRGIAISSSEVAE